jgi:hypothetical protein
VHFNAGLDSERGKSGIMYILIAKMFTSFGRTAINRRLKCPHNMQSGDLTTRRLHHTTHFVTYNSNGLSNDVDFQRLKSASLAVPRCRDFQNLNSKLKSEKYLIRPFQRNMFDDVDFHEIQIDFEIKQLVQLFEPNNISWNLKSRLKSTRI